MKHKDIIIGQEAICPDGLGRVNSYNDVVISINTYFENKGYGWAHDEVELIDPGKRIKLSSSPKIVKDYKTPESILILANFDDLLGNKSSTQAKEAHHLINKCIGSGISVEILLKMTSFVWNSSSNEERIKWFRYSTLYALKNAERKIEDMNRYESINQQKTKYNKL